MSARMGGQQVLPRPPETGKAGGNGSYTSREKRWVIYNGANDASRVPPNGTAGCIHL
jgi:NADH:ubiquinone oxidoreductase subunit